MTNTDHPTAPSPPIREQGGDSLADPEKQKAYVAGLQRDLNRHLSLLGAPARLAIDGIWDEPTQLAFLDVCRTLGIAPEREVRTYRLIAGAAVTMTAEEQIRRSTDGAAFAAELKARFSHQEQGVAKAIVLSRSLPKDERDRAYVAFLQRNLNDHLLRLGSPYLLGVDGKWGRNTERAFERVCKVLGVAPARSMRTYRIVAGALADRTEDERRRAAVAGAAYEQRLRDEFAHQRAKLPKPPEPKPPRDKDEKPRPPAGDKDNRLAAAIRRHGGHFEREIIVASRATKVPVALLCAILEQETGFSNVFGSDNVKNPVKSRGRPFLPVTRERYQEYLGHRNRGLGQQGVGPMQLTTASYQDRADKLGGCWKPGPNIMVGAQVLVEKTRAVGGGLRNGVKAYNSWSPAGDRYADEVMPRFRKWQRHLGTSDAAPSGPRTLRLTKPAMRGADVKIFQRAINQRLTAWKVAKRIETDGGYGPETARAAREVASGLGIAMADCKHGFSPAVRRAIIDPTKRTKQQKQRARGRAQFRSKLRKANATPPVGNLLRGHRAPKSNYLLHAIARAHKYGLVVTSTNDGGHASTSWHYRDHAVDFGIVPGSMSLESKMRQLIRFQRSLAKDMPRLLELFGPDAKAAVKNGRPVVMSPALRQSHLDHVHLAAQ